MWLRTAGVIALTVVVLLSVIPPAIDRYRSYVPFVADLDQVVPADTPLYVTDRDQLLLGAVGFYSGRRA